MNLKYAFLSSSLPEASIDELISAAQKYGYDGIEPRVLWNHKHGIELDASADVRANAKKKSADSGIEIACISTSLRFSVAAEREQTISDCIKYIQLAKDVGCSRIRVFGGDFFTGGATREQATATAVEGLCLVAKIAEDAGVTICMETHDEWSDPRDVVAVVAAVDSPSVGVLWDILHPIRAGKASIRDSFNILTPYIKHVHLHDGFSRSTVNYDFTLLPIGEGIVNHEMAIRLLRGSGFTGFLSGEWIKWEPAAIHLPRERETCRRLEAFSCM